MVRWRSGSLSRMPSTESRGAPSAVLGNKLLLPDELTLDELLQQEHAGDWLEYAADHYQKLLHTAFYDCKLLNCYSHVTYLIDFDVLKQYLTLRTIESSDTYFVDALFSRSSQPYALPIGAFYELLEWLAGLANVPATIAKLNRGLSASQALNTIAKVLTGRKTRPADKFDALQQVRGRLSEARIALQRLSRILEDDRFQGVVSQYDQADLEVVRKSVARCPRVADPSGSTRSRKDERDSLNIAIAVKSMRTARTAMKLRGVPRVGGYVLVSQTILVLDLLQYLQNREPNVARVFEEWSGILGEPNRPAVRYYPVLRPRQVLSAEILGIYSDPENAILRAHNWSTQFFQIAKELQLQTHLSELERSEVEYENIFNSLHTVETLQAARGFLNFIRQMLKRKEDRQVLHALEMQRASAISISLDHKEITGRDLDRKDEIAAESLTFAKALRRVEQNIGGIKGFGYQIVTSEHPHLGVDAFEVLQRPSTPMLLAPLTGEKYCDADSSSGYSMYVVRWPVVCRATQFLCELDSIVVRPRGRRPRRKDRRPTSVWRALTELNDSNSGLLDEGFVAITSAGVYGCDLDVVLSSGGFGKIKLRNSKSFLRRVAEPDHPPAEMRQLRICTLFGDFIFDVNVTDGEDCKFAAVYSHLDISKHVAWLYCATTDNGPLRESVRRSLSEVLSDYDAAASST